VPLAVTDSTKQAQSPVFAGFGGSLPRQFKPVSSPFQAVLSCFNAFHAKKWEIFWIWEDFGLAGKCLSYI
jgi:hypothetical protein